MHPDPEPRPVPPEPSDAPPDSPPAEPDQAVDIAGTEADEEAVGEALERGRRRPARPDAIDETAVKSLSAYVAPRASRVPYGGQTPFWARPELSGLILGLA